ncbi:cupin domain-containing protein [Nocardia arthritidis]|uniref:Cupin domain-containing protein n=1 Tax=Nocardia arthritidis TaxID=228602 RepID=A0A6G9YM14_9NOCA|nr:cupin domain-containing protein [Nocardia arthritidis]QIS14117.1 cupin domain-containing protein [Nocardia arthritidis]
MSIVPDESEILEDSIFGYRVRLTKHGDVLHMEIWADPGGGAPIAHRHPGQEERFEILDGEVTFRRRGEKRKTGPGDRITIPAGASHSYVNTGSGIAHLHVEFEPASNMDAFFREGLAMMKAGKLVKVAGRPVPRNFAAVLEMAELFDRFRHTMAIAPPAQKVISLLADIERRRRLRQRRHDR